MCRQKRSDIGSLAPLGDEALDVVLNFDCLVRFAVPEESRRRDNLSEWVEGAPLGGGGGGVGQIASGLIRSGFFF